MHWYARTFVLLLVSSALPAAAPDWDALNEETLRHFQALVQMDTSDPPGREQPAVDYLRGHCQVNGGR